MRQQSSLARLLASAAVTAMLAAGLGGCQTMADVTGSLTSKAADEPPPRSRSAALGEVYGERYRANPKDVDAALSYGQALARHRAARPGRRRARAGHHRQSRQQGAAGRLRSRTRRQRQFPAGVRRSQPGPLARQSGLADSFGAGNRARSSWAVTTRPAAITRAR